MRCEFLGPKCCGRALMTGRVRYSANGSVKIGLKCTATTTPNENWVLGEIYSTTKINCPPGNAVLYPTVSVVA
jgi:hypothetical protein